MLTRRALLKTAPLLALAPTLPSFLVRTARAAAANPDGRVLVVVQLDGGNDALNTVIPHADPEYARLRPVLKVDPKNVIKVTNAVGLHPSLRPLAELLEKGQLAILPGVGYPNPSRSHFRSMAIWQTAQPEVEERSYGWLGRTLDPDGGSSALIGGGDTPLTLRGRRSVALSLTHPEDLVLSDAATARQALGPAGGDDLTEFVRRQAADGYGAAEKLAGLARTGDGVYPGSGLGERLRLAARLLKSDLGARVFYTFQGSYDTHASQTFTHANLLREFAEGVRAFFADLSQAKLAERVALLAFSEFGRTIKENGSGGTDHGTAGCVFLAGPGVKGGLIGTMPNLSELDKGEPKMTTDFRRIYAAVLQGWLNCPGERVLGPGWQPVPVF